MISAITTFFSNLLAKIVTAWRRDRQLRQDGANEAELEGRKEADEIAADIKRDRNDDGVRNSIREKHFRD